MEKHCDRRSAFNHAPGNIRRLSTLTAVLLISIFLASASETQDVGKTANAKPRIAQVFFAQQHVQTPDNPYFKLVGNLEALIKVQVYADTPRPAPAVSR